MKVLLGGLLLIVMQSLVSSAESIKVTTGWFWLI